eukprot:gene10383-2912_t
MSTTTQNNFNILRLITFINVIVIFLYFASDITAHQEWGMNVILVLQRYRNILFDIIMRIASLFGFEIIMICIPILFWSGKKEYQTLGLNISHVSLFGLYIVGFIKAIFKEPRPFQLFKTITGDYSGSKEFSFPSAHTFCSVIVLFVLGDYLIEKMPNKIYLIRTFVFLFSLLVGLSRIYFGVHFPHDVICGLCGGLFTWILHSFLFGNIKRGQKKLKLFLIGLMLIFNFLFIESQQISGQIGLYFSPSALFAFFITEELINEEKEDEINVQIIKRSILGLLPIPIVFVFFYW